MPEVAQLLKVNIPMVHNYRKAGLLKFLKLGRFKVRATELDRFLEWAEGKDLTNPFNVVELNVEVDDEEI